LFGVFAGSVLGAIFLGVNTLAGMSEANAVRQVFGQGLWPSIGLSVRLPAFAGLFGFINLAILSIMTGILRRRWLGLAATGLILVILVSAHSAADLAVTVLHVLVFLAVLTRVGLVAAGGFTMALDTLRYSPPLDLTQWYAGRAVIALLPPLALLVCGFYVSLGGQPILGSLLS